MRKRVLPLLLLLVATSAVANYGPELPLTTPRQEPAVEGRYHFDSGVGVAANARGSAVVWTGTRPLQGTYLMRFDPAGNRIDPVDVYLGPPNIAPAIATDGVETIVVGGNCTSIDVRRIASDGTIGPPSSLGPVGCSANQSTATAAVATNGETVLIVVGEKAFLLARDHSVVGQPALDLSGTRVVKLASNGDGYGVAIRRGNEVRVVQLSRRGEKSREDVLPTSGFTQSVDIDSDGRDYFVVWNDMQLGLTTQRIGANGEVGVRGFLPSQTSSSFLSVTWSGSEYLIVFPFSAEVRGIRLSREGALIASGVVLGGGGYSTTDVDAGPNGVTIVSDRFWPRELVLAETRGGSVFNLTATPVSSAAPRQILPVVVDIPDGSVVLWLSRFNSNGDDEVRGARFDRDTNQRGQERFLGLALDFEPQTFRAAFDGTYIVVAWAEGSPFSTLTNPLRIYARRYTTDLVPIEAPMLLSSQGARADIGMASGNGAVLILWLDWIPLEINQEWRSTVMRPTGQTIPARTSAPFGNNSPPVVAWNGAQYLVVWQASRSGLVEEVRAQRLDGEGRPIDSFPVAVVAMSSIDEVAVASKDGEFYVLWQGRDTATASWLLMARRLTAAGTMGDLERLMNVPGSFQDLVLRPTASGYVAAWTRSAGSTRVLETLAIGPNGARAVEQIAPGNIRAEIALMAGEQVIYSRVGTEHGGTEKFFRRLIEQRRRRSVR